MNLGRALAAALCCLAFPACHSLHLYSGFGFRPPGLPGMVIGGLSSAAISRATGGCVAQCSPGWICDGKTGLCAHLEVEGTTEVLSTAADGGVFSGQERTPPSTSRVEATSGHDVDPP